MSAERHRELNEAGISMVEVVVVAMILTVIMSIIFLALVSVQNTVNRTDLRSQTNDQTRLAEEEIVRQIRSGNVLYDPGTESANAGAVCAAAKPSTVSYSRDPERAVGFRSRLHPGQRRPTLRSMANLGPSSPDTKLE